MDISAFFGCGACARRSFMDPTSSRIPPKPPFSRGVWGGSGYNKCMTRPKVKGIISDVNDKFCELSKYSRSEQICRTDKLLKSGHHPKEFFEHLWSTIKSGQVWKGEIKNRAKDGTYYWVDTTIVTFVDEKGKPYQDLAIRFEITDRKRVEEALRQSEALLRQQTREPEQTLSKLKRTQVQLVQSEKMSSLGQMVAGVAHEINNRSIKIADLHVVGQGA